MFPGMLNRLQQVAPEAQVVAVYGSTEAEPMAHVAWSQIGDDELLAMRSGKGLLAGRPVAEVRLRVIPDRLVNRSDLIRLKRFLPSHYPLATSERSSSREIMC